MKFKVLRYKTRTNIPKWPILTWMTNLGSTMKSRMHESKLVVFKQKCVQMCVSDYVNKYEISNSKIQKLEKHTKVPYTTYPGCLIWVVQ